MFLPRLCVVSTRLESRPHHPVDEHLLFKHGGGAHPQAALAIQRAVQRHGLQRLAVAHGVDHLIQHALVVAV